MDKTKTISAIILVAGIGKRISNYTIKPKCLLKIKGESLLSRNIRLLKNIGIKNILVVAGFKSNLVIEEIKKNKNNSFVNVILNKKFKTHGNCFSLKLGLEKIKNNVIYFDGDVIYEKKILQKYLENRNLNSILVGKGDQNDVECAKVFSTGKNVGRVIEKRIFNTTKYKFIGEAIGINKLANKEIKKFIKISNKIFKNKTNLSLNWDTFYDRFFLKKNNIKYFKTSSKKWVEIDTYDDLKKAKKIMK